LFFATKPFSTGIFGSNDGADIAAVGEVTIERQQLRDELEQRYGKEVLRDLIDEEVIVQTADKYGISVSDEELELEMNFIKAKYGSYDQQYLISDNWEEDIKQHILLEKLLVQYVVINESSVQAAYNKNKEQYEIPKTLHISHIVVETKKQAEKLYNELQDGSSFSVLAMEQSIDTVTATDGGDLGYINKNQTRLPESYFEQASKMKKDSYSKPIKVDEGYAILFLHEIIKEKSYSFKEVKSMIERQLAVEEIGVALSAEYFWDESEVEWKYE